MHKSGARAVYFLPNPTRDAAGPELAPLAIPGIFQPSQPMMTFLAKISPKPSMTPFTNGRRTLIATLASSASARVLGLSDESNTASVAVRGAAAAACACTLDGTSH